MYDSPSHVLDRASSKRPDHKYGSTHWKSKYLGAMPAMPCFGLSNHINPPLRFDLVSHIVCYAQWSVTRAGLLIQLFIIHFYARLRYAGISSNPQKDRTKHSDQSPENQPTTFNTLFLPITSITHLLTDNITSFKLNGNEYLWFKLIKCIFNCTCFCFFFF